MSVRILVGIVKRLAACVFVSVVVLFACRAAAKDSQPQWKILQVKDFTATPNVKFTPEALNAFNETLRERLQKSGIADQVLDGNSTTPRADAGEVVILEGQLTNYLATPIAWDQDGSLNVEVTLYRGSDRRLIATIPLFIKLQYRVGNGKALGKETGHSIADAFRKAATDVPPLNSWGFRFAGGWLDPSGCLSISGRASRR